MNSILWKIISGEQYVMNGKERIVESMKTRVKAWCIICLAFIFLPAVSGYGSAAAQKTKSAAALSTYEIVALLSLRINDAIEAFNLTNARNVQIETDEMPTFFSEEKGMLISFQAEPFSTVDAIAAENPNIYPYDISPDEGTVITFDSGFSFKIGDPISTFGSGAFDDTNEGIFIGEAESYPTGYGSVYYHRRSFIDDLIIHFYSFDEDFSNYSVSFSIQPELKALNILKDYLTYNEEYTEFYGVPVSEPRELGERGYKYSRNGRRYVIRYNAYTTDDGLFLIDECMLVTDINGNDAVSLESYWGYFEVDIDTMQVFHPWG